MAAETGSLGNVCSFRTVTSYKEEIFAPSDPLLFVAFVLRDALEAIRLPGAVATVDEEIRSLRMLANA